MRDSTGQRRYRHPAISGRLPTPWLPADRKEYLHKTSTGRPDDIEAELDPLDLDLTASGAILIDIRRRWRDFRNVTKRLAVNGIERMRSPTPGTSTPREESDRRKRKASPGIRDELEYVTDSTAAWARDGINAGGSQPSRVSSRSEVHRDEHSDSDLDEEERENAARYTYYPHRKHRRHSEASSGHEEQSAGPST